MNADVYTEHTNEVHSACYAPSGFYICSGGMTQYFFLYIFVPNLNQSPLLLDAAGKVRIWDTTQTEHPLKAEYQPLGGAIKDIAWSPDSKRITVGGDGRQK
jgi:WD40 repeat protein